MDNANTLNDLLETIEANDALQLLVASQLMYTRKIWLDEDETPLVLAIAERRNDETSYQQSNGAIFDVLNKNLGTNIDHIYPEVDQHQEVQLWLLEFNSTLKIEVMANDRNSYLSQFISNDENTIDEKSNGLRKFAQAYNYIFDNKYPLDETNLVVLDDVILTADLIYSEEVLEFWQAIYNPLTLDLMTKAWIDSPQECGPIYEEFLLRYIDVCLFLSNENAGYRSGEQLDREALLKDIQEAYNQAMTANAKWNYKLYFYQARASRPPYYLRDHVLYYSQGLWRLQDQISQSMMPLTTTDRWMYEVVTKYDSPAYDHEPNANVLESAKSELIERYTDLSKAFEALGWVRLLGQILEPLTYLYDLLRYENKDKTQFYKDIRLLIRDIENHFFHDNEAYSAFLDKREELSDEYASLKQRKERDNDLRYLFRKLDLMVDALSIEELSQQKMEFKHDLLRLGYSVDLAMYLDRVTARISESLRDKVKYSDEYPKALEAVNATIEGYRAAYVHFHTKASRHLDSKNNREVVSANKDFDQVKLFLLTAECLYVIIPNSLQQYLGDANFDYSCCAIEYYMAIEKLMNSLFYIPYKTTVLDHATKDTLKQLLGDSYTYIMKRGRPSNTLEIGTLAHFIDSRLTHWDRPTQSSKDYSAYLKQTGLDKAFFERLGKTLSTISSKRNDAAHGSKALSYNDMQYARNVCYKDEQNQERTVKILRQTIQYVLSKINELPR